MLVVTATAWTHLGYNIAFYLAGLLALPGAVSRRRMSTRRPHPPVHRHPVSLGHPSVTWWCATCVLLFESSGHRRVPRLPRPVEPNLVTRPTRTDHRVNLGSSGAQSVLLWVWLIGLNVLHSACRENGPTRVAPSAAAPVEAARRPAGVPSAAGGPPMAAVISTPFPSCIAVVAFPLLRFRSPPSLQQAARPAPAPASSHISKLCRGVSQSNMGLLLNSGLAAPSPWSDRHLMLSRSPS